MLAVKPAPVAASGHGVKSKLDEINIKLKAGYTVADVKKYQENHSKGKKKAAKKPAAKAVPKKKPVKKAAPSEAIPDRNDVSEELAAEQAQRDAAQGATPADDA